MNTRIVEDKYSHNETQFDLYAVYPESPKPLPAILIAPAWDGLTETVQETAKKVAALGYAAVAIDLYGEGVRGDPKGDNTALMTPLVEDRSLLLERLMASYHAIQAFDFVDETKMAAIGYCFGGLCVLDLARAVPKALKAVVSFHGILQGNDLGHEAPIAASVLIEHGWDDPMATPDNFMAFAKEMDERQADWQAHIHGGAAHAFTFSGANKPDMGILYHEKADKRSWDSLVTFLKEKVG